MIQIEKKPKQKMRKIIGRNNGMCTVTEYLGETDRRVYVKEKWKVGTVKWFITAYIIDSIGRRVDIKEEGE